MPSLFVWPETSLQGSEKNGCYRCQGREVFTRLKTTLVTWLAP